MSQALNFKHCIIYKQMHRSNKYKPTPYNSLQYISSNVSILMLLSTTGFYRSQFKLDMDIILYHNTRYSRICKTGYFPNINYLQT